MEASVESLRTLYDQSGDMIDVSIARKHHLDDLVVSGRLIMGPSCGVSVTPRSSLCIIEHQIDQCKIASEGNSLSIDSPCCFYIFSVLSIRVLTNFLNSSLSSHINT